VPAQASKASPETKGLFQQLGQQKRVPHISPSFGEMWEI
jgi:hypothetical protein